MVIENYFDSETTTNRSSKLAGKVIILLPLSRIAKNVGFYNTIVYRFTDFHFKDLHVFDQSP